MKAFRSDDAASFSPQMVIPLLNRVFNKAGVNVAANVLQLYYLLRSSDVPLWAKTAICTALGYFIMTPDAIPDVTPVVGFSDDLVVLTSALATVASYLTPEIRAKVKARLQGWFGNDVKFDAHEDENTLTIPGEMEDRA